MDSYGGYSLAEVKALASALKGMSPNTSNFGSFRKGTIVSIEQGTPDTCTITLSGDPTEIPGIYFLDSYRPTVGDIVVIAKQGGSLLILGTIGNSPGPHPMSVLLHRTTTQSIATGTDTAISWSSVIRAVGVPSSEWWSAGSPTHVNFPWAGLYRVVMNVTLDSTSNTASGTRRALHLNKTSTINAASNFILADCVASNGLTGSAGESNKFLRISGVINVNSADTIHMGIVWHNYGTSTDLVAQFAGVPASMSVTYLGDE
jgi:hypothetical protein